MRRMNKGFTLVELLVVMAIISILAAIVVPNVIKYLKSAKATRARADITGIDGSLVKLLADSGRTSLGQLFNADQVGEAIGVAPGTTMTPNSFLAAQKVYTNCLYALLRDGRGAGTLTGTVDGSGVVGGSIPKSYQQLLNANVVRRLGTSYIDIGFDPWGNLFNIYPGPWPTLNGPIPFRKYFAESSASPTGQVLPGRGDTADQLTCGNGPEEQASGLFTDPDTGEVLTIGFPAPRDKVAYIWSSGENLASGQAIYNPGPLNTQYDGANSQNYYDLQANQEPLFIGGGDDVNNWDNGASWGRFY